MTTTKPLSLDTIAEVYDEMRGWDTTDEFRAAWHLHSDGKLYCRDDLLFCHDCGCSSLDETIVQRHEHWLCPICLEDAEREAEAEYQHQRGIAGWIKARQL